MLPSSAQPAARTALAELRDAEERKHALQAIEAVRRAYGAKWPKPVAGIVDDTEMFLSFFNYPAEHWLHLKTTHPIEATFATVRLRTRPTKGPGSKAAPLGHDLRASRSNPIPVVVSQRPPLVAMVRAGVKFEKGVMVERAGQGDRRVTPQRSRPRTIDYFSR